MLIFSNQKHRQMSNFQVMMAQMTLGSRRSRWSRTKKEKHAKTVVINVRIVEKMHIFGVLLVSRWVLLWTLVSPVNNIQVAQRATIAHLRASKSSKYLNKFSSK